MTIRVMWALLWVLATGSVPAAQAPDARPRSIEVIRGGLHQAREGSRITVFLVTSEGIILADPLNTAFARWLRGELTARFPGLAVRYVLHTHHHADRASGNGVFDATAELVAHDAFDQARLAARTQDPAAYAEVAAVESGYSSRRSIVLGGQRVELVHTGAVHAPDMTALYFPAERLVFAPDDPMSAPGSPLEVKPAHARHVRRWMRAVEGLEFDTLLSADGTVSTRNDVQALRERLDRTVPPPAVVLGAHAAANLTYYGERGAFFCPEPRCTHTVPAQAATGGVQVVYDRMGLVVELTAHRLLTVRLPADDFLLTHRQTAAAVLFRYAIAQEGRLHIAMVAGPSVLMGRSRGSGIRRPGVTPPERFEFASSRIEWTPTFGADVNWSLGTRLSLSLPVRTSAATRTASRDFGLDGWGIRAGIGLSLTLARVRTGN